MTEIDQHIPGDWHQDERKMRYYLRGTPFELRSDLMKGWHVCKHGKPLGDAAEYDTLTEAKLACERQAQGYLRRQAND